MKDSQQEETLKMGGIEIPMVGFAAGDEEGPLKEIFSTFSNSPSIQFAQLVSLTDGEGKFIYYPKKGDYGFDIEVGQVLYLRERGEDEIPEEVENGLIIQVVSLGTASYPQADTKSLFRLMLHVRATSIERNYNEPKEVMDEFLMAEFKVRNSIVKGNWEPPSGDIVTRNVDIFVLNPTILSQNIFVTSKNLNINLGDYHGEPVRFFGGGFEKINLVTGMKGGGKSHITKGIIAESLGSHMSAIIFDINNEYDGFEGGFNFVPGLNLKFRLDRLPLKTFIAMIDKLAPLSERAGIIAKANLGRVIRSRTDNNRLVDLDTLRAGEVVREIIPGNEPFHDNMRASYVSSMTAIASYNLIMTVTEIQEEAQYLTERIRNPTNSTNQPPAISSLRRVFLNFELPNSDPTVSIFNIGGFPNYLQQTLVNLILETLKDICERQYENYLADASRIPNYPTVYFEEAHMYMEPRVINELLPLIRHFGMNVFFITNTPAALPDSVFRLIDNLIMTRILNRKDIDQVKTCGLTDGDTIQGFATTLKKYHALLLSGQSGATSGFPLVFKVRDFGLPPSGVTKSMWQAMLDAEEE